MTPEDELRAALAAPSLEVWLDARCGLGERAYLDWARAAIAAAAEAQGTTSDERLSRIQASAMAWAREPTRAHAEATTRLAFEDSEGPRLELSHDGSAASYGDRAVLLAAAAIESVGAPWRENAELAIGEARRGLRARNESDAAVSERLARALVIAVRAPAPDALPRPAASVRARSLAGALPPLPREWRWHSDFDPSLSRHTRAIARDRAWPIEPDALDRLRAAITTTTRAAPGGWTMERRASGELEARTMIEILDAPDRAHVRITLLRDRRGHELVTLASIGAETTGAVETLVAEAIDRALAPCAGEAEGPVPRPVRARRTSATDLGRRVVESIVATAEGRPALPLGFRWGSGGSAKTSAPWPRRVADTDALLEAAARILASARAPEWTRTWSGGGPVLLRAGLDDSAIHVRFPGARGASAQVEIADVEVRAPSAAAVASVAHALQAAAAELATGRATE